MELLDHLSNKEYWLGKYAVIPLTHHKEYVVLGDTQKGDITRISLKGKIHMDEVLRPITSLLRSPGSCLLPII